MIAAVARQRLRSGGHELHGVREHQPGESLRGVHWPATAHHGRLMVKELDDPGGDELAVVLDARASADVGSAAGLELRAGGGRGRRARRARAQADARRVPARRRRRATASRRARASARPCAGCWRARGPRASARRATCSRGSPPSASRSSRAGPAALVGARRARAARRRRDRPVELRRLRAARRRGARGAARGRRARASSCGAPSASRRSAAAPDGAGRAARLARRCSRSPRVFGLLHARDLQTPGALDAEARRARRAAARSRPRSSRCAPGGGSACSRSRRRRSSPRGSPPATGPRPARRSAGSAGGCATRRRAWVQVVLPFAAASAPSCARRCCSRSSPGSRRSAWLWLVRAAPARRRRCSRSLPFALSATVYDLPQYPWRALARGLRCCSRSCARAAPAGGGRGVGGRASRRSRCWPARRWPPCPRPRGRRCCRGRPGRSRTHATTPSARRPRLGHALPSRSRSGRSRSRCCRCGRLAPVVLARGRARRDFDGLRFARAAAGAPSARSERGGVVRVPGPPAGQAAAGRGAGRGAGRLVPRRPRPARALRPAGRGRRGRPRCEDGSAELHVPPAAGPRLRRRGRRPATRRRSALRALPARYPESVVGGDLAFRRRGAPGASGRPAASATWRRSSSRTAATRCGAPGRSPTRRRGRVTRGAPSPYQAIVALEAWLRTTRAYDEQASLPEQPGCARALGCARKRGLLPDVRRLAGGARAPLGRAGARRRGIRARRSARRRLPRDRSRRPRLGGGLVPRLRLAAVRRHARARSPGPRVLVLGRVRRRRGAGRPRRPAAARPAALQLPLARLRAVLATGGLGALDGRSRLVADAPGGGARWRSQACSRRWCSLKRALLRLALPREPARAARGSGCAPSLADQGVELGSALTPREFAGALDAALRRRDAARSRPRSSARPTRGAGSETTLHSRARRTACCVRCAPRWDGGAACAGCSRPAASADVPSAARGRAR